jgi:hypothetical protein
MAKVSAKEIVKDIRSGMDDAALMKKYQISAQGLRILYKKLLDMGAITEAELSNRTLASDKTMAFAWKCPACGKPQVAGMPECPDCGIVVAKFREREPRQARPQTVVEPFPTKVSVPNPPPAPENATPTEWKCPSCGTQNENVAVCARCDFVAANLPEQRRMEVDRKQKARSETGFTPIGANLATNRHIH